MVLIWFSLFRDRKLSRTTPAYHHYIQLLYYTWYLVPYHSCCYWYITRVSDPYTVEVSTPSWRLVDHFRGPQQTPAIFAQTPAIFAQTPCARCCESACVCVWCVVVVCGVWCVVFSPCWKRPRLWSMCAKFLEIPL